MLPLELIIKNQAAHWSIQPTALVRQGEMIVGTVVEGSDIRPLYSFCRWLTIRARELSLSNADYEALSFHAKIAHDKRILPFTKARERADELLWQKMVGEFPLVMNNVPSVRLCVDWQVVMSPDPDPAVPRDKDGVPCAVLTRMTVFRQ
jgi:hypothetical protein